MGEAIVPVIPKLRVISGAMPEGIELEDTAGVTIRELGHKMHEVLNIGPEHLVLVNGVRVDNPGHVLNGTEEVEFIKPSGQKG